MAAPKLLSLLALASFLFVALSFGPRHVDALVADRAQVARHVHARDAVAKRKRGNSSSCQPRPTSSLSSSLPTSTPLPTSAPASTTPPASSTSSAAPSTTSTASSNSGKKWGLAWGEADEYLANFNRPRVGYCYNWQSPPPACGQYGMDPMPMLWGSGYVDQFQSAVLDGPDVNGVIALGPNEPNEPSQSNMSPQDAVNLWMQTMMPAKAKGYTLASPACTDDDAGFVWYQQFLQLCSQTQGCSVDILAFHSYTTDPQHLIDYATALYGNFSLPIMITEFADQDYSGANIQATMDGVWNFAGQVFDFVENTPWILAAFPFGVIDTLPDGVNPDNALIDPSTHLPTSLAYYYFG